jgi:hypothetical protein
VKLPKAIFLNDKIYTDIEIRKPKAKVLADVQETASTGDIYSAMYQFILGCTVSVSGDEAIDDSGKLKELIKAIPYRSAELVAIKIMLLVDPEDHIEGIYQCPRCGKKIIAELKEDSDTRDRISDLAIIEEETPSNTISYQLESPIIIKNTKDGSVIMEVDSVDLRIPTLADCILTAKQAAATGGLRFQIVLYKNCLIGVDAKFRAEWGVYLFEQMSTGDLKAIYEPIKKYGLQSTVEKRCYECGKVWEASVNTTNFFVSGLPSN